MPKRYKPGAARKHRTLGRARAPDTQRDGATGPADQKAPKKPSWGEKIFSHAVMLIFFVGMPALFTAMAPLTVTHFRRAADGKVSAHASTRFIFLIPFRQQKVAGVTTVSDGSTAGSVNRTRSGASSRNVRSEDSAHLAIEGGSGTVQVEVSPVNVASALAETQRFLDNPSQTHLRLITVANWKFGVFAGGFLSLLTLLYVFICVNTLFRWLRRPPASDAPAFTRSCGQHRSRFSRR